MGTDTLSNIFIKNSEGYLAILDSEYVDKAKNEYGDTPLHILAKLNMVPKWFIKKRYPWYKLKRNTNVSVEIINEILNTPQSIQFIKGG